MALSRGHVGGQRDMRSGGKAWAEGSISALLRPHDRFGQLIFSEAQFSHLYNRFRDHTYLLGHREGY